jgi:hypothetical protein
MNTIVINNQKGGVGKTTLAVHLAWFMAEAGRRVLMIDVDAQGNATDTLKHHAGSTTAAELFKPATQIVSGGNNGITLAPADSSLTDVDRGNAAAIMTPKQNLANANEQFDICVIDTPPSLGLRSVACLVAASSIRALYELYQAWRTHPDAIERLCATRDSFTDAEARQLARDLRAESDRADAQRESSAGSPQSERSDLEPGASSWGTPTTGARAAGDSPSPRLPVVSPFRSAISLTIRVRHQNRAGRLLIDRIASQGSRHAVVLVDGAEKAAEVPASTLTIEEILSR